MKHVLQFFILLSFIELAACKDTGGELRGISVLAASRVSIQLNSTSTWPGLCHQIEFTFTTGDSINTVSGKDRTVTLSTDSGDLYTDVGCTQALTTFELTQDISDMTFYFRSNTLGTATLSASAPGLTTGTATLTVGTPTALITLGQQAFNFNTPNFPALSDQSFNYPTNAVIAGGKMFVADYSNNRVLIWNSIPTSTQQAADLVLGQPDMISNACNTITGTTAADTLCSPSYVHSDGTRLVVADEGNSRVLIWTTLPTTDQEPADLVIGQANMGASVDGSAAPSDINLAYPGGVFVSGNKLFVADSGNNRILIWNTFPTMNTQAANVVIGQPDFSTNLINDSAIPADPPTATGLNYPYMVYVYQNKIFISDYGNSRILIWNSIPTTDGVAANLVLGQPDFVTGGINTGGLSASSLSEAAGVVVDAQARLYVSDYSNNRILVWNQIPTTNNQDADAVIGQVDFVSNGPNSGAGVGAPSATRLYSPWGALIHDGILWVSDYENHRILKFQIPY